MKSHYYASINNALDALAVGISLQKLNWLLDADIHGFFDNISREWMEEFLDRACEHYGRRVVRGWPVRQFCN